MNRPVGNAQLIQKMNRLRVLNYIRRNPDVARPMIAHDTGLSLSSVTNIISYLLSAGFVTESGMEKAERVGRKGTLLRFGANAYGIVCIFFAVGNVTISYTNLEGEIITRASVNVDNLQPHKIVEIVRRNVSTLLDEHGGNVLGIEIAISGLVLDGSRFVLSSSLKWKEIDLKALLEAETGLPVFIENVSLLRAVWYFFCGGRTEKENMLFIDLENGVGASQFYHGEMNRAMLGEIGHTTVEKDGEQCFCGNKGCLEAMFSEQRIMELYQTYGGNGKLTLSDLAERLAHCDAAAERSVSECSQYLGIGLANLVNLCKPSVIVINVGEFAVLRTVIERATAEMRKRAYPALLEELSVYEVSVSEEDTIRGAAFHLCDSLFDISYSRNPID